LPQSAPPDIRSKPFVCSTLYHAGWNKYGAWTSANSRWKPGAERWHNPLYREVENWLTAASDYFLVPFAREDQIVMHQGLKVLPFRNTTELSLDALDAGFDGLAHIDYTPGELMEWCNDKVD
jgi:hypothetical protein